MSPQLSGLDNILADIQPKGDLEALLSSLAISSQQSLDPSGPSSLAMPNLGNMGNLSNILYMQKSLNLGNQTSVSTTPLVPACTSLYVKNLPPEADRLWMYERYAVAPIAQLLFLALQAIHSDGEENITAL